MLIFVATDLHNVSKICEQPYNVSLCLWGIDSMNYTLAENSGTKTSFGPLISVAVYVQVR